MDYFKQEKGERVKLEGQELVDFLTQLPTLIQELQEKREQITNSIYQIASSQTEQLRKGYSVTEAIRWTEDKEAIVLGNWLHFSTRSGSTMTGQQYAETRVIPKIVAGDLFLDKVIAKRTDLMISLDNTLDEDLDSFDYTSIWDEEIDYIPPPIEEVSTSGWRDLMESIPFNIDVKFW